MYIHTSFSELSYFLERSESLECADIRVSAYCIIRILYCWNELILHCWNATILQYWNEVVLILHFRTEQMFLFMRDILILQFKLLHKNLFLRQVLWRGLLFLLL